MSSGNKKQATDAWQWLQEVRGLDAELLDKAGVRARNGNVGVPYVRRGQRYGWKVRSVDDKRFWFDPSGAERYLWNRDILDDDTLSDAPIIITEGEIDALSVMQAGYVRVVSVPDGWSEGLEDGDGAKMRPLLDAEAALRRSPCVIVAGDGDSPGASMMRAVAALLEDHPVRYVEWPADCKDANDTLRKLGEAEITARISKAKLVDPKGAFITSLSDCPPVPERRVLRMGYDPFDRVVAFEIGAMSVITGIPGHGKSTFAAFVTDEVTRAEKVKAGFMGFETPVPTLRDQLCRKNLGKPWDETVEGERTRLLADLDRRWRLGHRTYDDVASHNLGWLRGMVHTMAVRDQCKLIVIDPWNEVEHLPQPGESMTQYINFALQQIRLWSERWDCHIVVVAHPRKIGADGKVHIPSGYDIADSAAFVNKPSLGLTIHNDKDDKGEHVKVRVWKVRDVNLYKFGRGTCELDFDPGVMVYRRRAT